jgi:gamma-glutamyl phosphate reductase
MLLNELAFNVKKASVKLAAASTQLKNQALAQIAKALMDRKDEIIKANAEDLKRSEEENLAAPLLKRLKLDDAKIKDVVDGINSLIKLEDKSITKVEISHSDSAMTKIKELTNNIRENKPVEELNNIFEQLMRTINPRS